MYSKSEHNFGHIFPKGMMQKIAKDFCESTSLHGYSYLYIVDSFLSKLLWMFAILFTTAIGIFLFVRNTSEYIKSGIVTNIDTSSANLSVSISFRIF